MSAQDLLLACVPGALTPGERARSRALRATIGAAVDRVISRADGRSFRLRTTGDVLPAVAEWIPLERRCCPFLSFAIEWPAGEEAAVMHLTGPAGTNEFLGLELPELPAEAP
jgi:hypothetical protein